jgi:hypothetical protein
MLWTIAFWKGLGERALKSFIQGFLYGTGLSMLTTGIADGTGIMLIDVPWLLGLNSGAVLAIFSACTSILNPGFTAGQEDAGGDYDVEVLDEITTVTKYRPRSTTSAAPADKPRHLAE